MIKLEVEEYCQNCPEFKPKTTNGSYFFGFGTEDITHVSKFNITCKHAERCKAIRSYLNDQMEAKQDAD